MARWLAATGRTAKAAAHAAGVERSHIYNISNWIKKPSVDVEHKLADWLRITVDDLYRDPPPGAFFKELSKLSPSAREVLIRDGRGSPDDEDDGKNGHE